MKKKYLIYLLIAIAVIAAIGYYYYKTRNNNQIKYITTAAKKDNISSFVIGSGNIMVNEIAEINPSVTGKVIALSVKTGDKVKKGQFLFKIENDDLDVSVNKANISYLSAKQSLEDKKSQMFQAQVDLDAANLKNAEKADTYSDAQLSILRQKLLSTQIAVQTAQANIDSAWSDYQNEQKTAEERTVISPVAGTITAINIKNNDELGSASNDSQSSSSDTTPIIVQNFKTMKAKISINEVDISKIKISQKATLSFDAISDLTLTGKVEEADNVGTASQGVVTYGVKIGLDAIDNRIKPEMTVNATIITETKNNVLIVPSSAIKTSNNSRYVQILANGQPEQKTVETGISSDTAIEIISGLNENEKVITQTVNSSSSSNTNRNNSLFPGMGGGNTRGIMVR